MGGCCSSNGDLPYDNQDEDLPEIDTKSLSDQYLKFELSLPFCRTMVNRFFAKVEKADKECGEYGFVTFEALRQELSSSAWAGLWTPTSTLYRLLSSEMFRSEEGFIETEALKVFGLLHCHGDPMDKAKHFYCLL